MPVQRRKSVGTCSPRSGHAVRHLHCRGIGPTGTECCRGPTALTGTASSFCLGGGSGLNVTGAVLASSSSSLASACFCAAAEDPDPGRAGASSSSLLSAPASSPSLPACLPERSGPFVAAGFLAGALRPSSAAQAVSCQAGGASRQLSVARHMGPACIHACMHASQDQPACCMHACMGPLPLPD